MLLFPVSWLLIGALSGKVSEGIVDQCVHSFAQRRANETRHQNDEIFLENNVKISTCLSLCESDVQQKYYHLSFCQ